MGCELDLDSGEGTKGRPGRGGRNRHRAPGGGGGGWKPREKENSFEPLEPGLIFLQEVGSNTALHYFAPMETIRTVFFFLNLGSFFLWGAQKM